MVEVVRTFSSVFPKTRGEAALGIGALAWVRVGVRVVVSVGRRPLAI